MESRVCMVASLLVLASAVWINNAVAVKICGIDSSGIDACRPAATKPNPTPPSPQCCKALSKADLKCLCEFKFSPLLPTFGIDPILALGLPPKHLDSQPKKKRVQMARKALLMLLALMTVVVLGKCQGFSLCDMNHGGLLACKPAVTKPNPAVPSADCCRALTGANLTCLCSYKSSLLLPSLGIDPDLCVTLPAKCNLQTPSNC
ncbi:hypothetical protein Ancab_022219 [Ancistrocladus abbreviatus]